MTEPPFTKAGLFAYLDIAIKQGMVNANTGNAWKAASNKVLSDLADEGSIENYDVRAAVLRYNNRNPGELTGESLKKYEQRTKTAIDQFIQWKTDPMNYKPLSRALRDGAEKKLPVLRRTRLVVKTGTPVDAAPAPPPNGYGVVNPLPPSPPPSPPSGTLTIPIPIRKGAFVVQLTIPVDMTTDEAKRISAVMTAYAHESVSE